MADFEPGQAVKIVGGTYKGGNGIFVKKCSVKVKVMLTDARGNTIKEVCLEARNIAPMLALRADSHSMVTRSGRTYASSSNNSSSNNHAISIQSSRAVSIPSALPLPQHQLQRFQSDSLVSRPTSGNFVEGQRVDVVGGAYAGRMGRVTKLCPVKIRVLLDGDNNDVCISRSSIRPALAHEVASDSSLLPSRPPMVTPPPPTLEDLRAYFSDQEGNQRSSSAAASHGVPTVMIPMDRVTNNAPEQNAGRSNPVQVTPTPGRRCRRQESSSGTSRSLFTSPSAVTDDIYLDAYDENYADAQEEEVMSHIHVVPSDIDLPATIFSQSPSSESVFQTPIASPVNVTSPTREDHVTESFLVNVVSDDDTASFMSVENFDGDGFDSSNEEAETSPPPSLPHTAVFHSSTPHPVCEPSPDLYVAFETEKIVMLPPGTSKKHNTFAHHMFGDRMLEVEIPFTRSVKKDAPNVFPTEFSLEGCHYQLLTSKVLESTSGGNSPYQQTRRVRLWFVAVSGPNLVSIDLQNELDKIAGFYKLSTRKAVARLELFQSPARTANRKGREFLIFDDLKSSDFESQKMETKVAVSFRASSLNVSLGRTL